VRRELTKTVTIYDLEGKSIGTLELPKYFEAPLRLDLIRRAVVAIQSGTYQPQGRDPMAGKRTTAESIGVGHGMSRVPRVKGDRYPRGNLAGFAPNTVKGRLTWPPVSSKTLRKKVNRKELKQAMLSALAATTSGDLVRARGHRLPPDCELPLIVSSDVEQVTESSEAVKMLKNLKVWEDVERASKRRNRGGRGSIRGRPHKQSVSALLVVEKKQGAQRAFRNFPGVKVVDVASLNVCDLAPGTHPGRLTIWTQSAIKSLGTRLGGTAS
jgi:large subunit ribosomal protein L4e